MIRAPDPIDRRRRGVIGAARGFRRSLNGHVRPRQRRRRRSEAVAAGRASGGRFVRRHQADRRRRAQRRYTEAGPANGPAVVLLHGWPYDINSFVDVAPRLAAVRSRVIVPYLRGFGSTRFLSGDAVRNGQQSALALDVIALMDALGIQKATIGGFDWRARTADIVAAFWPERCAGLVSVSGYHRQPAGRQGAAAPDAELQWWYQFYFATERGRAGYDNYWREFSKLIWRLASPKWAFDEATFIRTAASLDNPDHVAIVIHNYRWRLGLAEGEARYDDLEKRLASAPVIAVPTITLEGDANGAPHPEPGSYAAKFSGRYAHRTITGGVGHIFPRRRASVRRRDRRGRRSRSSRAGLGLGPRLPPRGALASVGAAR